MAGNYLPSLLYVHRKASYIFYKVHPRSTMSHNDLEISRQLKAAHIGTVRIQQLHLLLWEDIDVYGSRAFKQSKVDDLVHRFNYEGCRRLDPLTWIPCEVPVAELQSLLTDTLAIGDPKEVKLPEDCRLPCFQGQHRVAAALQWLPPSDLWWNVDLYDSQILNEDCRQRLRECDARAQSFSDGEIFRNVRHYQQQGKTEAAQEWLAKWSPTKCREFNRIYEPKESQSEFRCLGQKLDSLLAFPALWTSWYMGTHMPSLKCPEVRPNPTHVLLNNDFDRNLQTPCPRSMTRGSLLPMEALSIWTPRLLSA
jgi:hypothetical protein